jgi:hypothetical protein
VIVDQESYKCALCGIVKPRTAEHFYFDKNGRVTGYCRNDCQRIYLSNRYALLGASVRPPHYARDWRRRKLNVPPSRWRQDRPADAEDVAS